MSHQHRCKCEHENVKYCKTCKTVYCVDCKEEWTAKPTFTYWYGQPTYGNNTKELSQTVQDYISKYETNSGTSTVSGANSHAHGL